MTNYRYKTFLSGSAILAMFLALVPVSLGATPPLTLTQVADHEETDGTEQVTSVSQLSDVQPTDWAFQALQSLVERYGCIS